MKKLLLALFVTGLLAGTACQKKVDFEKEKAAIISVIEQETLATRTKNLDNWVSTVIQDEALVRLAASKTGYTFVKGFNQLDSTLNANFKNNPNPSAIYFKNSNYQIRVFSECAWVVYDENNYRKEDDVYVNNYKCARFLEKVDGSWKIAYQSYIGTTSFEIVQPLPKETLVGTHVMNITLRPGVTMEQFIQQFSTNVLPEMNNLSPQWKVMLVKSIRGNTDENKFGLIHIVQSDKIRDEVRNPDGSFTELGESRNKKFIPIMEDLSKFGTFTTKWADWIVQ